MRAEPVTLPTPGSDIEQLLGQVLSSKPKNMSRQNNDILIPIIAMSLPCNRYFIKIAEISRAREATLQ
jgi:hypothetical protein